MDSIPYSLRACNRFNQVVEAKRFEDLFKLLHTQLGVTHCCKEALGDISSFIVHS